MTRKQLKSALSVNKLKELQEKEEEALKKEWKDQQTGYKN